MRLARVFGHSVTAILISNLHVRILSKVDMNPTTFTLPGGKVLKYGCEICGKWLKTKQHYTNHRLVHTDLKPYECDKCTKRFKGKSTLNYHTKFVHENVTNVKKYKCNKCDAVFTREKSLKHHIQCHIKKLLRFRCEVCQKGFIYESYLKLHMRGHRNVTSACSICGTHVQDMNVHVRKHHKECKQIHFKCTKCDLKFSTKHELEGHRLNVHDENAPKFVCNICGKPLTTKYTFQTHVLSKHRGVKPYKCSYCDKNFAYKSNMTRHILTHTGKGSHKCKFCDKCFTQQSGLEIHMKLHTGKRPYKCNICNKAFAVQRTMELHKKKIHGTIIL